MQCKTFRANHAMKPTKEKHDKLSTPENGAQNRKERETTGWFTLPLGRKLGATHKDITRTTQRG